MRSVPVMKNAQLSFSFMNQVGTKLEKIIIRSGILIFVIGFLLGRAVILNEMSPFAIPFFASVLLLKREHAKVAFLSIFLGALLFSVEASFFVLLGAVLFLFLNKASEKGKINTLKVQPFLILLASLSARLFLLSFQGSITTTSALFAVIEASLSFILAMIFMQSIPLLTLKPLKRTLRNEEVVCFMILLASIMTGTIGWYIYDMSIENLLARYFVLLFAFVGGAAIGTTVGVVAGLILSLADVSSLYQMSLLAFSGLLGGLLKEGKKMGVGIGLMVGTLLIGIVL